MQNRQPLSLDLDRLAQEALVGAPYSVLRLGHSIAVLTFENLAAVAPGDRLLRAQCLLRQATGRGDIFVGRRQSGRPCLRPPLPELGISIAHSGIASLIGLSSCRSVGVDLEQKKSFETLDVWQLARDHFSMAEGAAIGSLEPQEARAAFMALWVAKEAILKLGGRGIFDGMATPDLADHIDALASAPRNENWSIPIAVDGLDLLIFCLAAAQTPTLIAALCQTRHGQ